MYFPRFSEETIITVYIEKRSDFRGVGGGVH